VLLRELIAERTSLWQAVFSLVHQTLIACGVRLEMLARAMMSAHNLFNFLLHRNRLLLLKEDRLMTPSFVKVCILICVQTWC
jgi:hypothetical protein